jgi:hypothetical protein
VAGDFLAPPSQPSLCCHWYFLTQPEGHLSAVKCAAVFL